MPPTPEPRNFRIFWIFHFFGGAGFGLREVSQWRDLEISLQMAFGRARGDISRPKTGTGTLDCTILLTRISDNLAYPEFYNLAYPEFYNLAYPEYIILLNRVMGGASPPHPP